MNDTGKDNAEWEWYTTPPYRDSDDSGSPDDFEDVLRIIHPEFSSGSDIYCPTDLLDMYQSRQHCLKDQVQQLRKRLKRVSLENNSLREIVKSQNIEKLPEEPSPVNHGPDVVILSASGVKLHNEFGWDVSTESGIMPVHVKPLHTQPTETPPDSDSETEEEATEEGDDEESDESTRSTSTVVHEFVPPLLVRQSIDDEPATSCLQRVLRSIHHNFSSVRDVVSIGIVNLTGFTLEEMFKRGTHKPVESVAKFSVKDMRKNISRFQRKAKPVMFFGSYLKAVLDWKDQDFTMITFMVYMLSVITGWFIQLILLICILKLYVNYVIAYRHPVHLHFLPPLKNCNDMLGELPFGKIKKKKKLGLMLQVAKQAQIQLGNIANSMEKLNNLFTWKVPQLTMYILRILVILFILSLIMPGIQFMKIIGIAIGIKVFILRRLYKLYPNFKYATDTINKVWNALPTDAEFNGEHHVVVKKKQRARQIISDQFRKFRNSFSIRRIKGEDSETPSLLPVSLEPKTSDDRRSVGSYGSFLSILKRKQSKPETDIAITTNSSVDVVSNSSPEKVAEVSKSSSGKATEDFKLPSGKDTEVSKSSSRKASVSKSPSRKGSVVSQSSSRKASVSKSPSRKTSVVSQSPSRKSSVVSQSSSRKASVSKSPSRKASVVSQSPSRKGSVVSQPTSRKGSVVSQSTSRKGSVVSQSSSRKGSVVSQPTSRKGSVVSQSPSRKGSVVSQSPSRKGSVVSQSPSRKGSVVSKSPSGKDIEVSKLPSGKATEVSKSPSRTDTEVSKLPSGKATAVSKSPPGNTTGESKSPPKKVSLGFNTPSGKGLDGNNLPIEEVPVVSGKAAEVKSSPSGNASATSTSSVSPSQGFNYSKLANKRSGSTGGYDTSYFSMPAELSSTVTLNEGNTGTLHNRRSTLSTSGQGAGLGESVNSLTGTFFTRPATFVKTNRHGGLITLPNGEQPIKEAPYGWTCVLEESTSVFNTKFHPGTLYLSLTFLCFKPTDITSSPLLNINLCKITKFAKAKKAMWTPGKNRSEHIHVTVEDAKKPYVFGSVLAYSECYKVVMVHGKVHNYQWAAEYAEIPQVFPNDMEYYF